MQFSRSRTTGDPRARGRHAAGAGVFSLVAAVAAAAAAAALGCARADAQPGTPPVLNVSITPLGPAGTWLVSAEFDTAVLPEPLASAAPLSPAAYALPWGMGEVSAQVCTADTAAHAGTTGHNLAMQLAVEAPALPAFCVHVSADVSATVAGGVVTVAAQHVTAQVPAVPSWLARLTEPVINKVINAYTSNQVASASLLTLKGPVVNVHGVQANVSSAAGAVRGHHGSASVTARVPAQKTADMRAWFRVEHGGNHTSVEGVVSCEASLQFVNDALPREERIRWSSHNRERLTHFKAECDGRTLVLTVRVHKGHRDWWTAWKWVDAYVWAQARVHVAIVNGKVDVRVVNTWAQGRNNPFNALAGVFMQAIMHHGRAPLEAWLRGLLDIRKLHSMAAGVLAPLSANVSMLTTSPSLTLADGLFVFSFTLMHPTVFPSKPAVNLGPATVCAVCSTVGAGQAEAVANVAGLERGMATVGALGGVSVQ